uniref:EamA domain-containing protein n=1 Tax=Corethron hystrix TaxID=216773 RepID=A0A7S1FNZ9_9STRA|mmetsp:Transcript_17006/g.38278  ORF Transcript_17006/g.38278 Transcript_17006/m.38278 type:complete len:489 (+) Transcript_17006:302-1768(+)
MTFATAATVYVMLHLFLEASSFSMHQGSCIPKINSPMAFNSVFNRRPEMLCQRKFDTALSVSTELDGKRKDSTGESETFLESGSEDITLTRIQEESGLSILAARGILVAVAVLWGTNFASVKYLENLCFHPPCNHPPSEAALARFGIAALVSLPLLIGQEFGIILGGLECGLWITLGYFSQAIALGTISSSKCAFLCSLTVVVVPLITSLITKKPPKLISLLSAMLAVGGVGILEGVVDLNSLLPGAANAVSDISLVASSATVGVTSSSGEIATGAISIMDKIGAALGIAGGDVVALLQSFGFGISFMRIEHYLEKYEHVENRVLTIAAAECVSVGICSLLWVLFDFGGHIPNMAYMVSYSLHCYPLINNLARKFHVRNPIPLVFFLTFFVSLKIEAHRIGAVAWTGIMTTVVAIFLEGIALQKATATDAALIFASEPIWASLFGAWLLNEKLGLNSYVGGSLIILACVVSSVPDLLAAQKNSNTELR